MAVNVEDRRAQLDNLNDFIENCEKKITSILNTLGWDVENLQKKSREMVTCPLNSEHYVPRDTLEKHVASCAWRMEGYHEQDIPLPEGCTPDESAIVIDKGMRTAIIREAALQDPKMKTGIPAVGLDDRPIPKTMDRIISDFTPDERRALYDFAVSKTGAAPVVKVEELNMPFQKEEKPRPKSFIERLAEERDAKRRKMSKKVHTNRKSHTEILREVIQNQMELYEDVLKQETEEYGSDTSRKNLEKYDYDPKLKESMSSSNVAHVSEKNVLLHKEGSKEDREELKRRERYQSPGRTEPGRSYLKHEYQHRIEQVRGQRKSEYDGRDSRCSHRERNSKKMLSTVHVSSERSNRSKHSHSHRRKHRSDKRRHRTHSSSDNSSDDEGGDDFHHKRKRSRDAEVNISQHRDMSNRHIGASGHKDISLKHELYGSKSKEKSTSFYKEDRKYNPKYDKSRYDESWYKLKGEGRFGSSRSYSEDGKTVCDVDNRYQKVSMKCDSSESRDSQSSDMKIKRQMATRSPVQKYSWERRNSDSSDDDSSAESHRHHMKCETNTGRRSAEGAKKRHHTSCV